jgi:hypothetical protein
MIRLRSVFWGVLLFCMLLGLPAEGLSQGGDVAGTVTFSGEPPKPTRMLIPKEFEVCGEGERLVDEVRVGEAGALEDVVVFVDGKLAGVEAPSEPPEAFQMIQQGCRFTPFIFSAAKGSEIEILNADSVAHNIHAYEVVGRIRRDLFSFQQPFKGHTRTEKLRVRRSNIVELRCDRHDFMRGWIVVPRNPFAVAASGGEYRLIGIPAGERTLVAFHPVLGSQTKIVTIDASKPQTVDFSFTIP